MNGDAESTNSRVSFSVKELLVEISRDIKDLRVDLGNKVDTNVVNLLMTQVNGIDKRVTIVEAQDRQKTRLEDLWFPIITSSIIGLIIGAVSVFAILKANA